MKDTYVYYNHKYYPIYTDSITDYFKRVKDNTENSLLSCFELFQLKFFNTTSLNYDPLNSYNITLSSETLSEITFITNKYLADKRIYIPVSLEKPNYYYLVARGSGKSIRELCYVAKVMSNHSSHMLSTTYSSEYKTQNYKSDIENLYKDKIFHKALDYYLTNIHHNQRSNNQEEMSCFKLIADRNNTNKKFHK